MVQSIVAGVSADRARAHGEVIATSVERVFLSMLVNVRALPEEQRVFPEAMVDIGWGQVPETRTPHNTRIVVVGGCRPTPTASR